MLLRGLFPSAVQKSQSATEHDAKELYATAWLAPDDNFANSRQYTRDLYTP
jgi:hypothetical protein